MARRYTLTNQPAGDETAPARPGDAVGGRRLGQRHWRLLSLVAQHGVLDTQQVTTLMFGSRPAAARHLATLVKAGLLVRFVDTRDRTHLAHYEISGAGAELLARRLHETGQPLPVGLGQRGYADESIVNDFFVRLVAHSRRTGQGHLYRWRHALDTAAWLRSHGILHLGARGYGIWVEDNRAIGFLLHLDHDQPHLDFDTPPPAALLSGYQQAASGVPVDVALVITPTTQRERQLHDDTPRMRLLVRVAATTFARLHTATSPADAIWSIGGRDGLVRLIEVG